MGGPADGFGWKSDQAIVVLKFLPRRDAYGIIGGLAKGLGCLSTKVKNNLPQGGDDGQ